MNRVLVSDIMTRQPLSVKPETSLLECAKILVKKRIGSLLLAKDKKLEGFISTQDILWAVVKRSREELSRIKAIDISPKKVITIKPDASIDEAVRKIKRFRFHRLPVVKNGEILGLLTLRDILNFYPELNAQLRELELIKEESEKLKRLENAKERVVFQDGICEECGDRGPLYRANGMLICALCLSSM